MIAGARVAAAIEILADIEARRRPAADALKDWGLAHRFAGSKDRSAIGALVFDALRRRASAACIMGEESPRAIILGALRLTRGLDLAEVEALFSGEAHAPAPLDEAERERFGAGEPRRRARPCRGRFSGMARAVLRRRLRRAPR